METPSASQHLIVVDKVAAEEEVPNAVTQTCVVVAAFTRVAACRPPVGGVGRFRDWITCRPTFPRGGPPIGVER